MRLFAALVIIALIGFCSILSLSIGLYFIAKHSLLERLEGVVLIIIGVALLGLWKHVVSLLGSRWSCF